MIDAKLLRAAALRSLPLLLLLLLAIAQSAARVSALRFHVAPGNRRCFTEELPSGSKVSGELQVSGEQGHMELDLWVTTLKGKVLFHRRSATHGKFTFATPQHAAHQQRQHDNYDYDDDDEADDDDDDTFRLCVEHQQPPSAAHPHGTMRAVALRLNHRPPAASALRAGRAASGSDTDRLQGTMRAMHTALSAMIGDLSQLENRERHLMMRVESTTRRVTLLAIVSLLVTIATSALQFRYFKGYFKQKKLC